MRANFYFISTADSTAGNPVSSPLKEDQTTAVESNNLFENNLHHENQDRAESLAKDATLEPESDDELFINEGPSLEDDDEDVEDDDSFQEQRPSFQPSAETFDESSNFIDEEDTTYGSPGLREAFNEGFCSGAAVGSDAEPSRAGSADTQEGGRRNKRKQFKPRNIVYSLTEESEEEPRHPHSERENSPMDLSVAPRPASVSDSESESSQAATADQSKPKPGGLSVVRPEILFGAKAVPGGPSDSNNSANNQDLNPLSLLSNMSGFPQGLNPFASLKPDDDGGGNAMKDAFKEVLKLYGVSSDMADNIMQSAGPVQSNTPGLFNTNSRYESDRKDH